MRALRPILFAVFLVATVAWIATAAGDKIDSKNLVTGAAAFGNAPSLKPGTYHKITANDLPQPFATESSSRMIWSRSHTSPLWNLGNRISPESIRLASSSILSTVGCGSLGTGAVGPDSDSLADASGVFCLPAITASALSSWPTLSFASLQR